LSDCSLSELLNTHEIDVAPLFADAKAVERAYFRDTGIFPIMHLVAIRRGVYEANPWIASSLYKAFTASKNWALDRIHRTGALRYMLPWLDHDVDEIDEVFGGDPWPYGVEANRPTLTALVQYMAEQNLIAQSIPIEDLFVPLPGLLER